MAKPETTWPHAVTLVIVAETPRQRRWAVSTALEIVRELAASRKVVVTDVEVRALYTLSSALDQAGGSGAGIVDVLFRGTSFSAVARRPGSEAFFFLPVGNAPPPLQVLYNHPRWKKIATRLADADAHMLPCVSAEEWHEAGPIPGFETCILLNASGLEVELPAGARKVAEFLAPPEIREAAGGPAVPSGDRVTATPGAPERVEAPGVEVGAEAAGGEAAAGLPDVEAAAEPAGVAAGAEPAGVEQVSAAPEPPAVGRPARETRGEAPPLGLPAALRSGGYERERGPRPGLLSGPRRRTLIPAAVLLAAAALVVAVWRTAGTRQAPEFPAALEAAADTTVNGGPDLLHDGAVPEGTRPAEIRLPYSVAIASYSSFEDALARQNEWTRPDMPVYVAPTPVRGVVYYRVYAGILPEREQAEELLARLVREGIKDAVRAWDVRPAQYAFSFGVYGSLRDARAVVETLLGQRVPAYWVPAPGEPGDGPAYHVYAGGYEKRDDAGPLGELIERAGLDAELVERVGLLLQ
jgi:hypothetical protein